MNEILNQVEISALWAGIISGLISSAMFLVILNRLKPSISIANTIVKETNGDEVLFVFKIINKSYFFKVYDIKVNIYSVKEIPSCNGKDEEINIVKLRKDFHRLLHRFNYKHTLQDLICGHMRLRTRTDYAAQFSTLEDVDSIIKQNRYIEIEVYAKHPLTGFGKIFTKQYMHKDNITNGTFYSGNSFRIKEEKQK